jgi:hypothetical protein
MVNLGKGVNTKSVKWGDGSSPRFYFWFWGEEILPLFILKKNKEGSMERKNFHSSLKNNTPYPYLSGKKIFRISVIGVFFLSCLFIFSGIVFAQGATLPGGGGNGSHSQQSSVGYSESTGETNPQIQTAIQGIQRAYNWTMQQVTQGITQGINYYLAASTAAGIYSWARQQVTQTMNSYTAAFGTAWSALNRPGNGNPTPYGAARPGPANGVVPGAQARGALTPPVSTAWGPPSGGTSAAALPPTRIGSPSPVQPTPITRPLQPTPTPSPLTPTFSARPTIVMPTSLNSFTPTTAMQPSYNVFSQFSNSAFRPVTINSTRMQSPVLAMPNRQVFNNFLANQQMTASTLNNGLKNISSFSPFSPNAITSQAGLKNISLMNSFNPLNVSSQTNSIKSISLSSPFNPIGAQTNGLKNISVFSPFNPVTVQTSTLKNISLFSQFNPVTSQIGVMKNTSVFSPFNPVTAQAGALKNISLSNPFNPVTAQAMVNKNISMFSPFNPIAVQVKPKNISIFSPFNPVSSQAGALKNISLSNPFNPIAAQTSFKNISMFNQFNPTASQTTLKNISAFSPFNPIASQTALKNISSFSPFNPLNAQAKIKDISAFSPFNPINAQVKIGNLSAFSPFNPIAAQTTLKSISSFNQFSPIVSQVKINYLLPNEALYTDTMPTLRIGDRFLQLETLTILANQRLVNWPGYYLEVFKGGLPQAGILKANRSYLPKNFVYPPVVAGKPKLTHQLPQAMGKVDVLEFIKSAPQDRLNFISKLEASGNETEAVKLRALHEWRLSYDQFLDLSKNISEISASIALDAHTLGYVQQAKASLDEKAREIIVKGFSKDLISQFMAEANKPAPNFRPNTFINPLPNTGIIGKIGKSITSSIAPAAQAEAEPVSSKIKD